MNECDKECYTCRYLKVDEHEDPCRQCFAFDAWKPIENDAEKTVKDWESRVFRGKVIENGNKTEC